MVQFVCKVGRSQAVKALEGVRVPILLNTGAEISILSTRFVQDLFPNVELSLRFGAVRNLGGGLVPVQGPIELTIEVCGCRLNTRSFTTKAIQLF